MPVVRTTSAHFGASCGMMAASSWGAESAVAALVIGGSRESFQFGHHSRIDLLERSLISTGATILFLWKGFQRLERVALRLMHNGAATTQYAKRLRGFAKWQSPPLAESGGGANGYWRIMGAKYRNTISVDA